MGFGCGKWEGAVSFGDASMLSFHATQGGSTPSKGERSAAEIPLSAALSTDGRISESSGRRAWSAQGGNAKMNEFCAAMGLCNLRHFDEEVAKRKAVAERYWTNLGASPA